MFAFWQSRINCLASQKLSEGSSMYAVIRLLMLVLLLSASGCGGGGSSDSGGNPEPDSVSLKAQDVELQPGQASLLTATVSDVEGPIGSRNTSFSILRNESGGTIERQDRATSTAGIARATYRAGAQAGNDILGVKIEPYGEATVSIKVVNIAPTRQTIKIEAEPNSVPMGGVSFLTATVTDKDGPVPGLRGGFRILDNQSGARLFILDQSTDPNGRITANYRAGNIPGTDLVEARFGQSIVATVKITVTPAGDIQVTPKTLKATQFMTFSQNLVASGGRPPYSFSLAPGSQFPPGISMSQNGVVSGNPAPPPTGMGVGKFSFVILVEDSLGRTKLETINLEVVSPSANFAITTTSVTPATIGIGYNFQFSANNEGRRPYTWSFLGLSPSGLSISPSGLLSGTPIGPAGTMNIIVQVEDNNGQTDQKTFLFTVNPNVPPLQILTNSLPDGTVGSVYPAQSLLASGGTPPYEWICPGFGTIGLNCSNQGIVDGIPTLSTSSTFFVHVTVTDSSTPKQSISGQVAIKIN